MYLYRILYKCFFLIIVLVSTSLAQIKPFHISNDSNDTLKGKVHGIILDSLSNKPIESASIVVFRFSDSTLVKGAISDKEGRFNIVKLPLDTFYVKISCIGYKSRKRNRIILNNISHVLYLDSIRLSARDIYTPEVEIIAKKDRLVFKDDLIILNIDRSLGNNAKEVLENSPLVEVSFNGNVSLMGSPLTSIFIDGQPAGSSGFENFQDLRLLDVDEVEKIELITNPSIEYRVAPPARVINIVRRKVDYSRYSANADADMNTLHHLNGNVGTAYGYKDFFIRSSYRNEYSYLNTGNELYKNVDINDATSYLKQIEDNENKTNSNDFRIFGGQLGSQSRFGLQVNYSNRFSDNTTKLQNNFTQMNNLVDYQTNRLLHNKQQFFSLSTSYLRNFGLKNGVLTARFAFMNNAMNILTDLNQYGSLYYNAVNDLSIIQKNISDNRNNSFSWEANYLYPWKNMKISVSYKGSSKNLHMENNYSNYNYVVQKFADDPSQKNEQKYSDIEHQFMSSIETALWGIRLGGGLGFIKNIVENKDILKESGFRSSSTNMIAGCRLGTPLPGNQSIFASYMYERSNPSNRQLNPYIDNTDSTNIIIGNPELKPSVRSNVDLNYSLPLGEMYVTAAINYSSINNSIEQITVQKDAMKSVTSYYNIGNSTSYGANLYVNRRIFGPLNISLGSSVTEDAYSGINSDNRNLAWGASLRQSLNMDNMNLQLDFNYTSSRITAQEKAGANYYFDAYLRYYILEKKLSFTFSAADILNTRNLNSTRYGDGFYAINNKKEDTRIFTVSISYYLQGNSKEEIPALNTDTYGDDF